MTGSNPDSGERRRDVVRCDGQIEVIVEGKGPAVVLLPSSGRDSYDFDYVADHIAAAGYRVLRPQPRGIGGSSGPMDNLNLHDLARDVAATIERFADGSAIVVGHAFGNIVARMTAVDRPDLVRGVVLAAAAAKGPSPVALGQALRISADTSLADAQRLEALRFGFFAPGHDPWPWMSGWHRATMDAQSTAIANTPQDAWWPAGKAPILDLQAGRDPWRPLTTGNDLRMELGNRVSVRVIFEASHALFPEQPAAVVNETVTWMRHQRT